MAAESATNIILLQVIAYYNGVRLKGQEPEGVSWDERAYRSKDDGQR